jgi:hypothetical protein
MISKHLGAAYVIHGGALARAQQPGRFRAILTACAPLSFAKPGKVKKFSSFHTFHSAPNRKNCFIIRQAPYQFAPTAISTAGY